MDNRDTFSGSRKEGGGGIADVMRWFSMQTLERVCPTLLWCATIGMLSCGYLASDQSCLHTLNFV